MKSQNYINQQILVSGLIASIDLLYDNLIAVHNLKHYHITTACDKQTGLRMPIKVPDFSFLAIVDLLDCTRY